MITAVPSLNVNDWQPRQRSKDCSSALRPPNVDAATLMKALIQGAGVLHPEASLALGMQLLLSKFCKFGTKLPDTEHSQEDSEVYLFPQDMLSPNFDLSTIMLVVPQCCSVVTPILHCPHYPLSSYDQSSRVCSIALVWGFMKTRYQLSVIWCSITFLCRRLPPPMYPPVLATPARLRILC